MGIKGNVLIGVALFGLSTIGFAAWEKNVDKTTVKVSIESEAGYSSRSEEVDVAFSHIAFQWLDQQKMSLNEAKKMFKSQGASSFQAHKVMLSFSSKFSLAPSVVRDSSEEKAFVVVENTVNEFRDQVSAQEALLVNQIEGAIDAAIASNQALAPFRDALIQDARLSQHALFDQIEGAYAQINAQEVGAKNEVSSRVDELVTETIVQEIAVELGYVLEAEYNGGRVALFARAGKFNVSGGLSTGATKQTSLEKNTAQNILAQRAMGTSGTAAVNLTKIFKAENYSVQTDIYIFHDRIPWVSAQQYITSVLAMEQTEWEQHDDLSDLDSAMIRLLFENDKINLYVSVGSYDGEEAYAVGGMLKISNRDRIYVDYFAGDRENVAEKGYSSYFTHDFGKLKYLGENVTGFTGAEAYEKAYMPNLFGVKKIDYEQFGLGLSKNGSSRVLGAKIGWKLKAGIYHIEGEDSLTGKNLGSDNYGMFTVGAKF